MTHRITIQTKRIEAEIVRLFRHHFGSNFVALECLGSRAYGDDRRESDYDGMCILRTLRGAQKPDLSDIAKRYGIRIGIGLRPAKAYQRWIRKGDSALGHLYRRDLLIGRRRMAAGTLPRPPKMVLKDVLDPDWRTGMQYEYWLAFLPGLPTNVTKREARRHVGYVIAACDQMLLAKGVNVRKSKLPEAMRTHYPRSGLVPYLERALRRRREWSQICNDKREIARIRRDLKGFLAALKRYVFPSRGGMTAAEAVRKRSEWVREYLRQ